MNEMIFEPQGLRIKADSKKLENFSWVYLKRVVFVSRNKSLKNLKKNCLTPKNGGDNIHCTSKKRALTCRKHDRD